MVNGNFLKISAAFGHALEATFVLFLATNVENVNLEKKSLANAKGLLSAMRWNAVHRLLLWKYPSIKFVEGLLKSLSNDPLLPLHQMYGL